MNDASKLQMGQAHYSAMLYPQGTFVDDIIVHKLSDNDYLIVINAGTREKDFQWVKQNVQRFHCHASDYSDYYTQLAIQGPKAADTLAKLTNLDLSRSKATGSSGERSAACRTHSSLAPATPAKTVLRFTSHPTSPPVNAYGTK